MVEEADDRAVEGVRLFEVREMTGLGNGDQLGAGDGAVHL